MHRINTIRIQLVKEKSALYETKFINCPSDAFQIAEKYLENVDREHFCIMLLDTKNKVIGINTVSIGTLNSSLVHPREVFKSAILANANSLILFHNHPSGDATPSREDIDITEKLIKAGEIMQINIFDHIIVGDNRYISLKERGII